MNFSRIDAPRTRPAWRVLLVLLTTTVCWLAFTPAPPTVGVDAADKINHLLAFSTLAAVAAMACSPGWRNTATVVAALLALGGFIEAVQSRLPYRSAEWGDLAADAIGIAIGLVIIAALRRGGAARSALRRP